MTIIIFSVSAFSGSFFRPSMSSSAVGTWWSTTCHYEMITLEKNQIRFLWRFSNTKLQSTQFNSTTKEHQIWVATTQLTWKIQLFPFWVREIERFEKLFFALVGVKNCLKCKMITILSFFNEIHNSKKKYNQDLATWVQQLPKDW